MHGHFDWQMDAITGVLFKHLGVIQATLAPPTIHVFIHF